MRIPKHLAIIMDGNGRWAQQRQLPRVAGHQKGVETVQDIVAESNRLGINYLTLYAFSSENWGRPDAEVEALMGLLGTFLNSQLDTMLSKRIKLNVIGEIDRLPEPTVNLLQQCLDATADQTGMVLTLALSYGSRNEIVRAVRTLAAQVSSGQRKADEIDEECVRTALDTNGLPDPELLIRTSGELRISNFLLWQIAYSELVFTDILWPDFTASELVKALEDYSSRQRRFGLTGEQLGTTEDTLKEDTY
jgi:undecaprenyl diphosphate synthase